MKRPIIIQDIVFNKTKDEVKYIGQCKICKDSIVMVIKK